MIAEKTLSHRITIELEQETDGRWIAEAIGLPGVLVYGNSRSEALSKAQALALRVLADKLEDQELQSETVDLSFVTA